MPDPRRNGHLYRRMKRRVLAPPNLTCWLCGNPIDKRLRYPHPMSPSVDHVVPISLGGPARDPRNMKPAHLSCNQSRGNGTRTPNDRMDDSRDW